MANEGGYPKWAKSNTSTVPYDPSNQINKAKGEPDKLPPTREISKGVETITDGNTKVVTNTEKNIKNPDISRGARQAYFSQHGKYPPCLNQDCRLYMVAGGHKNCLCYQNTAEYGLAHGGEVKHFCDSKTSHHESCEYFADGGQISEQRKFAQDPSDALDHVGVHKGLVHLLQKTGTNGRSDNEHKYLEDYIDDSKRGHKTLESHASKLIGKEKIDIEPDIEKREELKKHLNSLQENPSLALETGGNLGQTLPSHASSLGYKLGTSAAYLHKFKPQIDQNSPLDIPSKPTKMQENHYNRQLDIANNPSLILKHAQEGTLQPSDLVTLQNIYPTLHGTMKAKAFETLVNARTNGTPISRIQKHGLSMLLGQPLDSTQTPMSMQAIMRANAPSQSPGPQGQPKKASGKELDQIDKTAENLATPTQKRLMGKS